MKQKFVLIQKKDSIARVTLNRPEALNALSYAVRDEFVAAFSELAKDKKTEVIILTGAGKAFSAGLDLKELGKEDGSTNSAEDGSTNSAIDQRLTKALLSTPQPIICAVNGYAITGAFELVLMCDIIIASSEAIFADTHARVGVVPGWGLSQRLPRIIGIHRAIELSLTGNFLDAKTAYEWGLVNRVVKPSALISTCETLAKDIISTDSGSRVKILEIMNKGWQTTLEKGLVIEKKMSTSHLNLAKRAADITSVRKAIQARGRKQGGS